MAIYSKEDFGSVHRYKADESFLIGQGKSPVGAYLAAEEIVATAQEQGVDAIHPGYGFLSENTRFVELCEQAGIAFVGPPSKVIHRFGDKTEARSLAREFDVPIVPGTGAQRARARPRPRLLARAARPRRRSCPMRARPLPAVR